MTRNTNRHLITLLVLATSFLGVFPSAMAFPSCSEFLHSTVGAFNAIKKAVLADNYQPTYILKRNIILEDGSTQTIYLDQNRNIIPGKYLSDRILIIDKTETLDARTGRPLDEQIKILGVRNVDPKSNVKINVKPKEILEDPADQIVFLEEEKPAAEDGIKIISVQTGVRTRPNPSIGDFKLFDPRTSTYSVMETESLDGFGFLVGLSGGKTRLVNRQDIEAVFSGKLLERFTRKLENDLGISRYDVIHSSPQERKKIYQYMATEIDKEHGGMFLGDQNAYSEAARDAFDQGGLTAVYEDKKAVCRELSLFGNMLLAKLGIPSKVVNVNVKAGYHAILEVEGQAIDFNYVHQTMPVMDYWNRYKSSQDEYNFWLAEQVIKIE